MTSHFTDKVATMGGSGTAPQNNERDFLRFARRDLGVDFQLYMAKCIVRKRGGQATADMDIWGFAPARSCALAVALQPRKVRRAFRSGSHFEILGEMR